MNKRYRFRSLPHKGSSLGISRQTRTALRIRICRKKLSYWQTIKEEILEAAKLVAASATLGYALGFVLSNFSTFIGYRFVDFNPISACCMSMAAIFVGFMLCAMFLQICARKVLDKVTKWFTKHPKGPWGFMATALFFYLAPYGIDCLFYFWPNTLRTLQKSTMRMPMQGVAMLLLILAGVIFLAPIPKNAFYKPKLLHRSYFLPCLVLFLVGIICLLYPIVWILIHVPVSLGGFDAESREQWIAPEQASVLQYCPDAQISPKQGTQFVLVKNMPIVHQNLSETFLWCEKNKTTYRIENSFISPVEYLQQPDANQ